MSDAGIPRERGGRNCKCAFMACNHCRKDHDLPGGSCRLCPTARRCPGWL